jgi:uncharacterized protein (DUF433 family)
MISSFNGDATPLWRDEYGKFRVGDTRVLLELVIHAFNQGETPEEIVDSYPSLRLADVYAVIAYYLYHRVEIDAYVRQADEKADQIQRETEANYSPQTLALRARLHTRRKEKN